jgi:hypothetical protein
LLLKSWILLLKAHLIKILSWIVLLVALMLLIISLLLWKGWLNTHRFWDLILLNYWFSMFVWVSELNLFRNHRLIGRLIHWSWNTINFWIVFVQFREFNRVGSIFIDHTEAHSYLFIRNLKGGSTQFF